MCKNIPMNPFTSIQVELPSVDNGVGVVVVNEVNYCTWWLFIFSSLSRVLKEDFVNLY